MKKVESDEQEKSIKLRRNFSTNEQSTTGTDAGEPDRNDKDSFIPRQSPRFFGQVQGQELVNIEKESGKQRFPDEDNESKETRRQEMRRAAQRARRSSMSKNERGTSSANEQLAVRTNVGEPDQSGVFQVEYGADIFAVDSDTIPSNKFNFLGFLDLWSRINSMQH
ncbi:hypothetical protein MKW98_014635 [Papaver atlanticum]|uniref:Uncharacterized protein n=1 Tax=Papaver atlanticum TaxID=357466 RepID=A0AAD4SF08_9MAGN|nr:hypothetical protein MKW98_014635 [Papaver atlanticum]